MKKKLFIIPIIIILIVCTISTINHVDYEEDEIEENEIHVHIPKPIVPMSQHRKIINKFNK